MDATKLASQQGQMTPGDAQADVRDCERKGSGLPDAAHALGDAQLSEVVAGVAVSALGPKKKPIIW